MSKLFRPTQQMDDLLKQAGSYEIDEAYKAQSKLALAAEIPTRQEIQGMDGVFLVKTEDYQTLEFHTETFLKYARQCRWDCVMRAIELLHGAALHKFAAREYFVGLDFFVDKAAHRDRKIRFVGNLKVLQGRR